MKVLFLENIPAPYRVDFFNELGKYCELTVLYENVIEAHRRKEWIKEESTNYKAIFLKRKKILGKVVCPEVCKYVSYQYDQIVVAVYNTPTSIMAMHYMKLHGIKFAISIDGGMINENETALKRRIKKHLISGGNYWISPSEESDKYLLYYGANRDSIFRYYFTSLRKADILGANELICNKSAIRRELKIKESKVVLSVGRFNLNGGYGKGYDTLLIIAQRFKNVDVGFYIVGDDPTEEFIQWKKRDELDNVHFVGFLDKTHIADYYAMADVFVLFTRSDVWGLVINEAMAYSLPIITTDKCVAGLELVHEGINGHIIPVADEKAGGDSLKSVLECNYTQMGANSAKIICDYTIEMMAKQHMEIFGKNK